MLRVITILKHSAIHGIGLFAGEHIAKGTVTWEYDPEFDSAFSVEDVTRMPKPAQVPFWKYAYLDKLLSKYVLCADDQRFINHSTVGYNIRSTPRQDVALCDIAEGEELLCNYNDYDDTYLDRLPESQDGFRMELVKSLESQRG